MFEWLKGRVVLDDVEEVEDVSWSGKRRSSDPGSSRSSEVLVESEPEDKVAPPPSATLAPSGPRPPKGVHASAGKGLEGEYILSLGYEQKAAQSRTPKQAQELSRRIELLDRAAAKANMGTTEEPPGSADQTYLVFTNQTLGFKPAILLSYINQTAPFQRATRGATYSTPWTSRQAPLRCSTRSPSWPAAGSSPARG